MLKNSFMKLFLLSKLITTTFILFSIEDKESLIFKGYMNLSDAPIILKIDPDLEIELKNRKSALLQDYTITVQPDGHYQKFSIQNKYNVKE